MKIMIRKRIKSTIKITSKIVEVRKPRYRRMESYSYSFSFS